MRRRTPWRSLLSALAAFCLAMSQSAWAADEVRYLTWDEELGKGAIETAEGVRWVELGDSVPGFGMVVEIGEEIVVLRRVLDPAERQALESQGLLAPAAEEIGVLRWDLRFIGIQITP